MLDKMLLAEVKKNKLPNHIAIIMDGNGRWAKKRNMPRTYGHSEGTKTVENIVDFSIKLGIKTLSLYAFSTENWKRTEDEIANIIKLIEYYIDVKSNKLLKNNVVLRVLGDIDPFPESTKNKIIKIQEESKNNNGLNLNIALNYGARSEIVYAVKKLIFDVQNNKIEINNLDYDEISKRLYTKGLDDVDLMIRPSGELRLSNFLMLQSAYAELWFSDILWPDFNENHLLLAIKDYQKRDRRFGGVNE